MDHQKEREKGATIARTAKRFFKNAKHYTVIVEPCFTDPWHYDVVDEGSRSQQLMPARTILPTVTPTAHIRTLDVRPSHDRWN